MIAGTLISNDILPIRTSDTGDEALAIMNEFGVRHLPIVNNKELLGVISEDDILNYDVDEPLGSYRLSLFRPYVKERDHLFEVMKVLATQRLTLELQRRDYSLVEIARIVESENAQILSSFITTNKDAFLMDVTIKVNRPDIHGIIATFERFNYKIKASFMEAQFTDTLRERYDLLMAYLSV